MSIKNKTFHELKYIQWLLHYFQDTLFILKPSTLKIDPDAIAAIPQNLGVPLDEHRNYYFPVFIMTDNIGIRLTLYSKKTYEKFLKKKWKTWGEVDYYNKKLFLTDMLSITLDIWMLNLPLMNDLYKLYVEKNHILMERDFILLDFWFESLPVIDELILALYESNIKYKFHDSSTAEDSIFEYGCNDVVLKEVTGKNLKKAGCEDWWTKDDYINHIYKEFARIDINLLYQWLNYKNIPNIYETKETYVRQFITNETTGLKSLSLSTLKLLALNPLMNLDYIRLRKKQRNEYKATLPKRTPEELFKGIADFAKISKKHN